MLGLLLISVALVAVPVAVAQEPPTPLPPIVVREVPLPAMVIPDRLLSEEEARQAIERVPGSVAIVDQEEIEQSRAANLKDVLDFVPGVLIRPRSGAADESQLSIRGSGLRNNFHLRGVNILLDGFTYGNADGFSDFEALELLSTKRIEVYKAANALRFGANSLGGTINLVTKTGYDVDLIELRSEAGSFDFFKNYLATGLVREPFDVYLGYADTRLNGFRQHSAQERQRIYSTYGYRLQGDTTLRLDVSYARVREDLPGSLTREEFKRNPRQRNPAAAFADEARDYDYVRSALTVRTPLTATQTLEGALHYNYQDLDHPLSFAIIDNVTNNWGGELRYLNVSPLLGYPNRLTIGVQYFSTHQADVNFANVQGRRGVKSKDQINDATNVGLYAEEQFDATEAFTLVVGGRGQYAHRARRDRFRSEPDLRMDDSGTADFYAFSPKVGFIYRAWPSVQIYGNASHAYEPPLILELAAPGQIDGDLRQLKAQKAWQFEVGIRGRWGARLAWDVAMYNIELWDEIRNVNVRPLPGAPFTIPRYENIDRSRHTGVEVGFDLLLLSDLTRRMGFGKGGDRLGLHTAYTWSRFVFVDDAQFNGNNLPGAPAHYIRSALHYEHPSGFWLAPNIEWVPTSYVVNSENTARTEAYTLYNIRLGYDYKPWNLSAFFEAHNLTDKDYISAVTVDDANGRFFAPGDGRSFYGGISWRWR